MEKQVYKFTNEIDEIKVSAIAAKLVVTAHDEDYIYAEYDNPKETPKFCAVLQDKKLIFKEEATFFGLFNKPCEEYTISVLLPRKAFDKIEISTASGGADIKDIQANAFELATASGDIVTSGAFAEIKMKSASGNLSFTNNSEIPAKSLKVTTASGNVDLNAPAENYSLTCVSGKTNYRNACGTGNISITSGSVDVNYAEWNGALSLNVVSGKANITVPDDSAADLTFNGASGVLKTDIGGEKGNLMNIGRGTSGTLGSGNVQKLTVKLTSGTVVVARA